MVLKDVFKSFLPKGKTVDRLEDLGAQTVAELKSILEQDKEKKSGNKANLILRTFAIFCRAKNFEQQSGGRLMNHFSIAMRRSIHMRRFESNVFIFPGHPIFAERLRSVLFSCMNIWSSELQNINIFYLKAQLTRN